VKPEASLELARRNSCGARLVVGRLVEVWLSDVRSVTEWNDFLGQFTRASAAAPGRLVICADYRALRVLTPAVADSVLECLKSVNRRLERSALLLPKNAPTVRLQVDRLVREAKELNRRTCNDPAEAEAWLSPCLNEKERTRLKLFMATAP
jgi:hypothetical protein